MRYDVIKTRSHIVDACEITKKYVWHFDDYKDAIEKFIDVVEDISFGSKIEHSIEVCVIDDFGEVYKAMSFDNYSSNCNKSGIY